MAFVDFDEALRDSTIKRLNMTRDIINSDAGYDDPRLVLLAMVGASLEELTVVLEKIADRKL
jgi:hypothetical protein|tara:strand:- start:1060 stop:1245 length:186 start_codon:yes stop_codon:yes gene_type:complete